MAGAQFFRDAHRGEDIRTGRDADQQAFVAPQPLRCIDRILRPDPDDLIDLVRIDEVRYEAVCQPLYAMAARCTAGHDRGLVGFHGDDARSAPGLSQHATDAHEGTARTDAHDERVYLLVQLPQDFRARRRAMYFDVVGVRELPRQKYIAAFGGDLLGLL